MGQTERVDLRGDLQTLRKKISMYFVAKTQRNKVFGTFINDIISFQGEIF